MHLSPPPPPWLRLLTVLRPKAVVLLLTLCLFLLPLWESVIVLCIVVRYFMTILAWQSSLWGRESWLLCFICLPGVSWWLSGSSSWSLRLCAICDCGISWSYSLPVFALLSVLSSFGFIFTRKRKLVVLLSLSSWCLVTVSVLWLFLTVFRYSVCCTVEYLSLFYLLFHILICMYYEMIHQ